MTEVGIKCPLVAIATDLDDLQANLYYRSSKLKMMVHSVVEEHDPKNKPDAAHRVNKSYYVVYQDTR